MLDIKKSVMKPVVERHLTREFEFASQMSFACLCVCVLRRPEHRVRESNALAAVLRVPVRAAQIGLAVCPPG